MNLDLCKVLTEGSIQSTVVLAERPCATIEAVVCEEWEVTDDHDEVTECQIDDQKV